MKMVRVKLKGAKQDVIDIVKRLGRYNKNDSPERKRDKEIGLLLVKLGWDLESKEVINLAKSYLKPR